MIDRQFQCPRCGSSYFGTDGPNQVRGCHGQVYDLAVDKLDQEHLYRSKPCGFSWPVADDWKYECLIIKRERPDDPIVDVARKTAIACRNTPQQPQPGDVVTIGISGALFSLLEHPMFRDGIFAIEYVDVKTKQVYRTAITDDPKKRPWLWVKTADGWQQVHDTAWNFEHYCQGSLVPIESWQRPISMGGRS